MLSVVVVQRAAQVDRGTAAACRVHDGDDRAAEDSRYGAVAIAGLRVPHDLAKTVAERLRYIATRRADSDPGRSADAPGAGGRGQHARLAERVRSGARVCRRRDRPSRTSSPCSAWSAATSCSTSLDAVAAEDAPAAFALVETAIERGYDLRLLCRELARATRDLLILSVDPSRANDPGRGRRRRARSAERRSSHARRAKICCARSTC